MVCCTPRRNGGVGQMGILFLRTGPPADSLAVGAELRGLEAQNKPKTWRRRAYRWCCGGVAHAQRRG